MRTEGKVAYYNSQKRIGFISTPASVVDVFFHLNDVTSDVDGFCRGQTVSFLTRPSSQKPGRLDAFDVELVG
jgi:cold shock CspA family protein